MDILKKIVIYSHDTFGLGNIRRMLAITRHLLDSYHDLSILLITGSPLIHRLHLPEERFDYIKLPCINRNTAGEYGVKHLGTNFDDVVNLRALLVKSVISEFEPDLVLVDKKPCGVARELMPVLQYMDNSTINPQWVLLLRDILDSPAQTMNIWQKNAYHEVIDRFYERILVVGSSEIFDVRKEYELPSSVAEKVKFCGYLLRGTSTKVHQFGKSNHPNREKLVLVTPGGGEDGFPLLKNYVDGLKNFPLADFKSIIVTGPEMNRAKRNRINDLAARLPNVEVTQFTPDLPDIMRKADLVVSMAGYNTICEILSLGKRAIVVPRIKPVTEQWIRANRFAQQGLFRCIHPDSLTPIGLSQAISEELDPNYGSLNGARAIDFNGLANVTQTIRSMVVKNEIFNVHKFDPKKIRNGENADLIPNRLQTEKVSPGPSW